MNEKVQEAVNDHLVSTALRNINLAIHLLIEARQCDMTHAQRNGVEKVLESLLVKAARDMQAIVYVGESSEKPFGDIPF